MSQTTPIDYETAYLELKAKNDKLEAENDKLEAENEYLELKAKNAKLQDELFIKTEMYKKLTEENAEMYGGICQASMRVIELNMKLKKKSDKIKELKEESEARFCRIQEMEDEVARMTFAHDKRFDDLEAEHKENEKNKARLKFLFEEYIHLRNEWVVEETPLTERENQAYDCFYGKRGSFVTGELRDQISSRDFNVPEMYKSEIEWSPDE